MAVVVIGVTSGRVLFLKLMEHVVNILDRVFERRLLDKLVSVRLLIFFLANEHRLREGFIVVEDVVDFLGLIDGDRSARGYCRRDSCSWRLLHASEVGMLQALNKTNTSILLAQVN